MEGLIVAGKSAAACGNRIDIETVHLPAVVIDLVIGILMAEIVAHRKVSLGERNGPGLIDRTLRALLRNRNRRDLARRRSVGARKGRKEIVKAAILLHDDDHVLDRRRAFDVYDCRRCGGR